jgi:cation transport regulator ChaC
MRISRILFTIGSFVFRTLMIRLDDGTSADAIVPVYEGMNILPTNDPQGLARMVLDARGTSGSGTDYIAGVARELKKADITDPVVEKLAASIANMRTRRLRE